VYIPVFFKILAVNYYIGMVPSCGLSGNVMAGCEIWLRSTALCFLSIASLCYQLNVYLSKSR